MSAEKQKLRSEDTVFLLHQYDRSEWVMKLRLTALTIIGSKYLMIPNLILGMEPFRTWKISAEP
jgi:hypothetical protein